MDDDFDFEYADELDALDSFEERMNNFIAPLISSCVVLVAHGTGV